MEIHHSYGDSFSSLVLWLIYTHLLSKIPYGLGIKMRNIVLKRLLNHFGTGSHISTGVRLLYPQGITLGDNVGIPRDITLDGRGGIEIGDGTMIGFESIILTATHSSRDEEPIRRQGMFCAPIKIGRNVWISQYVYIDELHPEAVTIGDNCSLGLRTSIFTHFYWGPRKSNDGFSEVVIENDVFIGPHCLVLPGVRIKQGAVIKGGTVVTREVPAYTFWGPPGARPLGRVTVPLTPEHDYDEFVKGLRPIRKRKAK